MNRQLTMWGFFLIALGLMAVTAPRTVASPQTANDKSWAGVVSDGKCGAKHSTASDEAATCVKKCVEGGAKYVLVSDDKVYQLSDQDKFADFAGKAVKVTGTLQEDTIEVTSVEGAGA